MSALRRTLDPAAMNAAANHPDVFPHLGATCEAGALDLSDLVRDPANITLAGDHGGFLLHKTGAGVYEVHTLFAPMGRKSAHASAIDGLRYAFTATDAVKFVTKVPAYNEAARKLAEANRFRPLFVRDNAWTDPHGKPCHVTYYGLTIDHWAQHAPHSHALRRTGHEFHESLEQAKREAGSVLDVHPDDEAHDNAVGAAVLMIRAGNPQKGVWFYNEWAALAGYAPITILSLNPVVIDVRDAVIEVRNSDMEILLCR